MGGNSVTSEFFSISELQHCTPQIADAIGTSLGRREKNNTHVCTLWLLVKVSQRFYKYWMKSSIYLFSWFLKKKQNRVCVRFFSVPFLSRVKPWRGSQYVSPLLPREHAKPSADVHKIALEFVSNISHLPFCAWLGHASDRKWKTSVPTVTKKIM